MLGLKSLDDLKLIAKSRGIKSSEKRLLTL